MPQRRRHRRVTATPKLVARTADGDKEAVAVAMINLSESGAAIVAPERLGEIDDAVLIELPRSRDTKPLRFACLIRYVLGGDPALAHSSPIWLHGARFGELAEEARLFLLEYVRDRNGPARDERAARSSA